MIGCTNLLLRTASTDTSGPANTSRQLHYGGNHGPVIVWSVTKKCNLACSHCYIDAAAAAASDELSTDEACRLINDAATLHPPVVLFSGGEPLMRGDTVELCTYAVSKGLRVGLSTNGTLITRDYAQRIAEAGVSYVGVSIDGLEATHDKFRNERGAFRRGLEGLKNARDAGIKTGIRFTVNRHNVSELPAVTDLLVRYQIPRFCLYHLVYAGRASAEMDITNEMRVEMVDYLIRRTKTLADDGIEVLTTDNHADGIYILNSVESADKSAVMSLLSAHGGCSAGQKIVNIDPNGNVRPCQFWEGAVGNVRESSLRTIWNGQNELLSMLRDKKSHLRGRCSTCRYVEVCGGCRVRASRMGDLWGADPSCYLSDEMIRGGST
jgi:radical SAM protein with 4Fe4S-binding SPASM domain